MKQAIKHFAYELGADLVGVGSIDRCRNAPLMMSPQGLLPGAKSVVVMGIRHPDACIELGGEKHPQEIGPYTVQYLMNSRLDEMSYRMATFIEKLGHGAIGIVSSNIWRYNEYKDLKAVFAPDVSHIYMAVVAGLAELGFNGLAISPQYGARNRFVTVITDAEIEPDPLIAPGSVCDECMLCRKHCPAEALSKEIDGEKVLEIGEYTYRFPNKNLWRCSWGEHFDLDLDLEIPEKVNEKVILEQVTEHGVRGGEMGQCLKFCLPKSVRTFDRDYSRTPLRRYEHEGDESMAADAAVDQTLAKILNEGIDEAVVSSAANMKQAGVDIDAILPGAQSAVTLVVKVSKQSDNSEFGAGAMHQVDSKCYDLTRKLEDIGHRSIMTIRRNQGADEDKRGANPTQAIMASIRKYDGVKVYANTVVTRKRLQPQQITGLTPRKQVDHGDARKDLTAFIREQALNLGADLVGVTSVTRMDDLAGQLRKVFDGETVIHAVDDWSNRFQPWKPTLSTSQIQVKSAADWLPGAKSVLVFGLRYHKQVLKWATKPPAEAVGPYAFATYVTHWMGSILGYRLIKVLQSMGHTGVLAMDLTDTASLTASPRDSQPDLFANRFAAVAAGLGNLTVSGHLSTPQFGLRQRVMAIVTDAPLIASPLSDDHNPCAACTDQPCRAACPSQAITDKRIELRCEDKTYSFSRIDRKRCDWVKRYALMGDGGFKYLGSPADVPPPDEITQESLAEALKQHDPIKKYRPVAAEPCVMQCPLAVHS